MMLKEEELCFHLTELRNPCARLQRLIALQILLASEQGYRSIRCAVFLE